MEAGSDSKHYNMKQFIIAVKNYLQTKAEDTANVINRHLQLLSVTIDISIFDPHTNVVSEFFVSLYELMLSVEQRSAIAWCGVNVLIVVCRNPAARNALIHTYQFLPILSRLLGDQLSVERKIRLLSLMQELTCGMKISWQIPHLPHLMLTLTRWVKSEEEEIVTLSLAVLVNLCYRNLSAVYTLSRCVDVKQFVRTCMPLKGLKIEVHVCKLLIILDYMNGKIPEDAFTKLTHVTFRSLIEAFKAKDAILLRHIVEFYIDMWQQNNHTDALLNYNSYDAEVETLLQMIELETNEESSGDYIEQNPECMSLIFEFIHFLISLNLPKLKRLHVRLVKVALEWLQTEVVCSNSLKLLRTLAVNRPKDEIALLEPFLTALPVVLLRIDSGDEEIPTHIESNKRLSALMELLRVLVTADNTREKVLMVLKEDLISKIFIPLLGDNSPRTRVCNADTYTPEAVLLYVNAIALVDEIVKHSMQWINMYKNLMQERQIHMVVAQALYGGSKEIRALIMRMSANHFFPVVEIASAMHDLQPLSQINSQMDTKDANQALTESMCFPIISVSQLERLDEIINKLKEAIEQQNMVNVSTSDVMELYEYKLSSMSHAERAALSSVEAASQRCTHLQHRTAQLMAELTRVHQLLLHTQQNHEDTLKTKNVVLEENKRLQEWFDAELNKFNSQLAVKEKLLKEKSQMLVETTKKLKDTEEEKNSLDENYSELKRIVAKLEENVLKKDKLLEKKEEQIKRLNASNEHLQMQGTQLDQNLHHTQAELAVKRKELSEATKELSNCKKILGTITQLTNSQYLKP